MGTSNPAGTKCNSPPWTGHRQISARGPASARPDPPRRSGFITDIDDTILTTGMTDGLRPCAGPCCDATAGYRPGLYRGLARDDHAARSTFYVSSGPWNPLRHVGAVPGRAASHGSAVPDRLATGVPTNDEGRQVRVTPQERPASAGSSTPTPDMSFILIGDSGERDPEIYQGSLGPTRTAASNWP